MTDLDVLHGLPEGLLDCPARDLHRLLRGPTLILLPGRRPEPLFVSVLLHGNEDTGYDALREVLERHRGRELPRAMAVLIGNVAAAAQGVRTLDGQPDYNRVWPGAPDASSAEAQAMARVVERVRPMSPFASLDIHNNSGMNPHYACVTRLDARFLHLARLFSRVVVYFERPLGVQTAAFAPLCPSVTVECGKIGAVSGVDHAAGFIDAALHLSHFPQHDPAPEDLEVLQTVAIVKVPAGLSLSVGAAPADIRLREDLDRLNFSECGPGTSFGHASGAARLQVLPGGDFDRVEEFFDYRDGEIRLARTATPAMLTLDERAIRLDCLGYLMRRLPPQEWAARTPT